MATTNLIGKVDIDGKEGDTLAKDAEQGDAKVAVCGEEPVVEHAVVDELGFVNNQDDGQRQANGKRGRHMRIGPRIRVLGPREAHAEQHETRRKQRIANPV